MLAKNKRVLNINYSVKRELHIIEYACMLWVQVSIGDLQAINWIFDDKILRKNLHLL